MTRDERQKLIEQYNDGYRVVAEALTGIDDEQLDARPGPGKWSSREIVHHLADSEMTAATRLRLLLPLEPPPRPPARGPPPPTTRRSTGTTRTSSPSGCSTTGRSRRRSTPSRPRGSP